MHKLALVDPKMTYSRYGGSWHCDICTKSGVPGANMWHCTEGCEYDLCETCWQAQGRKRSLRSSSRARAQKGRGAGSLHARKLF